MKKMILILLMLYATIASAASAVEFTPAQLEVKRIAKEVAQKNCINGFCFTEILQAIAWQESSYGNSVIGDSTGTLYFFKHKGVAHSVNKENTFVQDDIRYTWYKPVKNKYIKRVYTKTGWKPLQQSSLGPFQIKVSTAQEVIERMELKQYYSLLANEQKLVSKLLTDTTFGATIAVNFLKMQYINANNAGHSKPELRAISRYNGGNNNTTYINIILKKVDKL